ncbi:MAG: ATP-binding cassette domain-containing protein [Haloarculaceae archaeon]
MIRLEDVSVALGDMLALDGVSLTVDRGEFVGLVGPNGAGKTTLLRAVNGALEPDAGEVLVDGHAVDGLPSRAASRLVATVPQDTSIRFAFTVADVVAMGRTPYHSRFGSDPDAREHVERALERTETAHLRDRRVSELSGGERQRVLVARALAQDAPALVLDEPTASLDINHAARTLGLVRDLAGDGRAALAAIHDLEAAARFCDRLLLLDDGAVIARGRPTDVLSAEALESTFDVRTAVTADPVTGTPSVTPLSDAADGGLRVHVLGGGRTGARALARLHAAGHDVSAGPLPEGDAALGVARDLDVPVTTAPPLSVPAPSALADARESAREADVIVVATGTFDPDGPLAPLIDVAAPVVAVTEQDDPDGGSEAPPGAPAVPVGSVLAAVERRARSDATVSD